jgi:hypothetical protein
MSNRILLTAALALAMGGCTQFGQVNQGRVIAFDHEKGLVTLVSDSNFMQPGNPRFDVLPAVTIRVPENPKEMGPPPEPGKLLHLDTTAGQMVVFDSASGGFKTIPFRLLDRRENARREELAALPAVDRPAGTVRLAMKNAILILAVPGEYLGLPEDTWKAGDEVRYYYKDPGQALRLMNVTRTDISTGKS